MWTLIQFEASTDLLVNYIDDPHVISINIEPTRSPLGNVGGSSDPSIRSGMGLTCWTLILV